MSHPMIAVIGAGNMGASIIGGLIQDGHPNDKLIAANTSEDKLKPLHSRFGIAVTTDNKKAAANADIIILAVKPLIVGQIARELTDIIQKRQPLIISIAAGITTAHIAEIIGNHTPIIRAMPNTPALINCGATALFANKAVSKETANLAESTLRAVGLVVWLNDESLMDVVTALSGSGPAYFFLIMDALQKGAESLGLPNETARLLTLQTALGAARMAMESDASLAELRRQVTSPGGTTEKGISVLVKNNIQAIMKSTLEAAMLRSKELATLLKEEN